MTRLLYVHGENDYNGGSVLLAVTVFGRGSRTVSGGLFLAGIWI